MPLLVSAVLMVRLERLPPDISDIRDDDVDGMPHCWKEVAYQIEESLMGGSSNARVEAGFVAQ